MVNVMNVMKRNAPILVLDEATSQLDSITELEIQKNLADFMDNRTVIMIAHRLSTLQSMDRIIVMSGGQIAEQGSHSELLALKGEYHRMWQRQSGK